MAIFVLTGFENTAAYDARSPSWEPDNEYLDAALCDRSRSELARDQLPQAQVEVIEVAGKTGRVMRIVTGEGFEDIV